MTESMETTSPGRTVGRKVRTVAFGALATAALSIPAVSALSVTGHDAGRAPVRFHDPVSSPGRFHTPVISPDSHRLALTLKPASLRLT